MGELLEKTLALVEFIERTQGDAAPIVESEDLDVGRDGLFGLVQLPVVDCANFCEQPLTHGVSLRKVEASADNANHIVVATGLNKEQLERIERCGVGGVTVENLAVTLCSRVDMPEAPLNFGQTRPIARRETGIDDA